MRITYDPDADALYLYLTKGPVEETEELEPGLNLDYNPDGRVIGIEVLDVSKRGPRKISDLKVELLK